MSSIQPYVLGSGNASRAIREAWAILGIVDPKLGILPAIPLPRGQRLRELKPGPGTVLCIANPHGLHARTILEADEAGFPYIVCEKPACTSREEISTLAQVKARVAVCHVYRQLWGIQTLRQMVAAGELGEVFAIEGRYWQSSTAQRVAGQAAGGGWKNDPALSGPFDALLDVGAHWLDAALFVGATELAESRRWLSYANSEAPHRDSHVHLTARCANGTRLLASISKNLHGAPNHFEISVLGTKKSATWKFLEADQLEVGYGNTRTILARPRGEPSAIHGPFHGLGWVEGYVGLFRDLVSGKTFPTLAGHLKMLGSLLQSAGET